VASVQRSSSAALMALDDAYPMFMNSPLPFTVATGMGGAMHWPVDVAAQLVATALQVAGKRTTMP
jgi:hypothetical protein